MGGEIEVDQAEMLEERKVHDGMGTGQEVRRGRGLIDTLWQSNKLACPFFSPPPICSSGLLI